MANAAATTKSPSIKPRRRTHKKRHASARSGTLHPFERFAASVARLSGRPRTFSLAVALILAWAVCGPLFGFSDTWQLVINTSTTIITFLMVFLIQHTQNRDSLAIQIKLAELILVAKGAENELATAEERSEEYLEKLHATYRHPPGTQL
jgi:low affinity Fe/Cu permease